jgi:acyl-CoA thioester hydrolase
VTTIPTYEQVAALPEIHQHVVGPEHLDENQHMNIGHYFAFGGSALWARHQRDLGMPDSYITERGLTTFTAEQHLRYLGESVEGDRIGVSTVVVDRSARALHAAALVVNHTRRELSCVMEGTTVHVDFATRRPVPFPDDVAALLDAAIDGDRPDWPLPLSGGLGIRR